MLVRYIEPNYILVYKNFYYFIKRIIVIIVNKGDEQYITYTKFFLEEFAELVSIISNMIYMEVLELKFCGLDYELKKNIAERSESDILKDLNLLDEKEIEMGNNKLVDEQTETSEE